MNETSKFKETLFLIRKMKQKNLKISGKNELYFARQFLLNCEIVLLARNFKYKTALYIFEQIFTNKGI